MHDNSDQRSQVAVEPQARHGGLQARLRIVLLVLAAVGLAVLAGAYLPQAVDWHGAFYPGARALMEGRTPYPYGVYTPPWALLPLVPFAVDEQLGRGGLFVVGLAVYAWVAIRLGARPVALVLWLTSPPLLHSLLNGNLEWLVFIGLLLPPRWGMFFVLIKPQVAGMVALWWTVEAWREKAWRGVWALWWPVTLAFVASVILFGWWPGRSASMAEFWWNASLWPWSIPAGLVLLGVSLWRRDWRYALAASPLLTNYVLLHAWAGAVLATVHNTRLLAVVVGVLWFLVLRQAQVW